MTDILHINDNNLLLEQDGNLRSHRGFAWLKGEDVWFDLNEQNNAYRNCRIEPQQINNRYWQLCDQSALPSNQSGMRHAADLIWRQLVELKNHYSLRRLVLVVPPHYLATNISLLLGIAKVVELEIVGVVNKAVVSVTKKPVSEGCHLHIDVQLHQTVASEVIVANDLARLGQVEVIHDIGLQEIHDRILKEIQQRFISQDRFDPLYYAETEQQLFNQLSEVCETITREGKSNIEVLHAGQKHLSSLDVKQWRSSSADFSQRLLNLRVDNQPVSRILDFNGFSPLPIADAPDCLVDRPTSTPKVIAEHLSSLEGGDVVYRVDLPRASIPKAESKAESVNDTKAKISAAQRPKEPNRSAGSPNSDREGTHLVQAGIAVSISEAEISLKGGNISIEKGTSNLADLFQRGLLHVVADENRTKLQTNDRLASPAADGILQVIRVA